MSRAVALLAEGDAVDPAALLRGLRAMLVALLGDIDRTLLELARIVTPLTPEVRAEIGAEELLRVVGGYRPGVVRLIGDCEPVASGFESLTAQGAAIPPALIAQLRRALEMAASQAASIRGLDLAKFRRDVAAFLEEEKLS